MAENTDNKVEFDSTLNCYVFLCPHCQTFIQVERNAINCAIFRHGYFYNREQTGQLTLTNQMNPHTPKEECERLVRENKIVGCGKPFQLVRGESNSYLVKICNYI